MKRILSQYGLTILVVSLLGLPGCSFEDSQKSRYTFDEDGETSKQVAQAKTDDDDTLEMAGGAKTGEYGGYNGDDPYGTEENAEYMQKASELLADDVDLEDVTDSYDWKAAGLDMKDPATEDTTSELLGEDGKPESGDEAYFGEKNKENFPGKEPDQAEPQSTVDEYIKQGKGTLDPDSSPIDDPVKAMGGVGHKASNPDAPATRSARRAGKRRAPRPKKKKSSSLRVASTKGVPQIRMASGVTTPQLLPTGTGVGFSVEYQFTRLGPQSDAKYIWVIRSRSGKTMARQVPVRGAGRLQTVVPQFRPDDKPFQTMILEVKASGIRRQVSKSYVFPTT